MARERGNLRRCVEPGEPTAIVRGRQADDLVEDAAEATYVLIADIQGDAIDALARELQQLARC